MGREITTCELLSRFAGAVESLPPPERTLSEIVDDLTRRHDEHLRRIEALEARMAVLSLLLSNTHDDGGFE